MKANYNAKLKAIAGGGMKKKARGKARSKAAKGGISGGSGAPRPPRP